MPVLCLSEAERTSSRESTVANAYQDTGEYNHQHDDGYIAAKEIADSITTPSGR